MKAVENILGLLLILLISIFLLAASLKGEQINDKALENFLAKEGIKGFKIIKEIDLNNDKIKEIIIENDCSVLPNSPQWWGYWALVTRYNGRFIIKYRSKSMRVGKMKFVDFNNDGYKDIVLSFDDGEGETVEIYQNVNTEIVKVFTEGFNWVSDFLEVKDLDGDKKLELILKKPFPENVVSDLWRSIIPENCRVIEVYSWDGEKFITANEKFPHFFKTVVKDNYMQGIQVLNEVLNEKKQDYIRKLDSFKKQNEEYETLQFMIESEINSIESVIKEYKKLLKWIDSLPDK